MRENMDQGLPGTKTAFIENGEVDIVEESGATETMFITDYNDVIPISRFNMALFIFHVALNELSREIFVILEL